jgi:hypothetical protein
MKIIILISIAIILVVGAIFIFYKPTYQVSYNGELLGYVTSKGQLQSKINDYITKGNGESNVAFVQIQSMPKYEMCLLKREVETNDEEVYNKIIGTGVSYYKYYTILLNGEEKYNLSKYEDAESVINQLKEKNSISMQFSFPRAACLFTAAPHRWYSVLSKQKGRLSWLSTVPC